MALLKSSVRIVRYGDDAKRFAQSPRKSHPARHEPRRGSSAKSLLHKRLCTTPWKRPCARPAPLSLSAPANKKTRPAAATELFSAQAPEIPAAFIRGKFRSPSRNDRARCFLRAPVTVLAPAPPPPHTRPATRSPRDFVACRSISTRTACSLLSGKFRLAFPPLAEEPRPALQHGNDSRLRLRSGDTSPCPRRQTGLPHSRFAGDRSHRRMRGLAAGCTPSASLCSFRWTLQRPGRTAAAGPLGLAEPRVPVRDACWASAARFGPPGRLAQPPPDYGCVAPRRPPRPRHFRRHVTLHAALPRLVPCSPSQLPPGKDFPRKP